MNGPQTTIPFRKIFANENNELFRYLLKDSLLFVVFIICSIRARRISKISPEGLAQGEFFLSETEYEKFGLKRTQKGQIIRRLLKLIHLGLISNTEKRIGSEKSAVYTFLPNQIIDINYETVNEIEKEQIANRELTETNNNDNNVKNEKNVNNRILKNSENISHLEEDPLWTRIRKGQSQIVKSF